jgi:hypothetical protein
VGGPKCVAAHRGPGQHRLAGHRRHLAGPGQRRRAGGQDFEQPVVGPPAQHHTLVGGQFGVAEQPALGHRVQRHAAVAEEAGEAVDQHAEPQQRDVAPAVEVGEPQRLGHLDDSARLQRIGGEAALDGVQRPGLFETHPAILRHRAAPGSAGLRWLAAGWPLVGRRRPRARPAAGQRRAARADVTACSTRRAEAVLASPPPPIPFGRPPNHWSVNGK